MPWHDDFGGPGYTWGRTPNTPQIGGTSWSPWRNFDRATGPGEYDRQFRGDWQREGHGPTSMRDYGWEYRGGYPHDAGVFRTDARMGDARGARMAQRRSGGLPRGRERFEASRWNGTLGRGRYDAEVYRRDERVRYGMEYMGRRWG